MKGGLARKSDSSLAKYDPERGLKSIAVAEAAEKHFARAKDATKLQQAIRAKLTAQAEFVFWWDNHVEKAQGQRSDKPRNRPDTKLQAGKNGIPDRVTISRWRKRLNDPAKFEATYEAAVARYVKMLEFEQHVHIAQNSGDNEWYTPAEYIEAARNVLGDIDLDPATTDTANAVVKAAHIFTSKDSGLEHPWHGRVWMNPPYAQPAVEHFAQKLAQHIEAGDVTAAVVLVNNATETAWFQTLVGVSSALCFPRGRVRFWSPGKESATPLQGQALLYAGSNVNDFLTGFAQFGFVVQTVRP